MAWFGNVSLGNFPDLAGAVNKLSESVKNIEKNFDSALGLEEKSSSGEASGIWPSASDRKTLFDPVMSFMGHRGDDSTNEALGIEESPEDPSSPEVRSRMSTDDASISGTTVNIYVNEESEDTVIKEKDSGNVVEEKDGTVTEDKDGGEPIGPTVPEGLDKVTAEAEDETESSLVQANKDFSIISNVAVVDSALSSQEKDATVAENSDESQSDISKTSSSHGARQTENIPPSVPFELHQTSDSQVMHQQTEIASEQLPDEVSLVHPDVLNNGHAVPETESPGAIAIDSIQSENCREDSDKHSRNSSSSVEDQSRNFDTASREVSEISEFVETGYHGEESEADSKEKASTTINVSDSSDPMIEVEKVKKEMKLMEAALQGAARQAQAKADEISRLMNENEHLKSMEDLKRKSTDAEIDALRDEYHQRVAALERKVYALTRERDTLRREHNKKSDAAALLKEKDEIICQVMAEGEELSKKQAAQESTIRKLRAQAWNSRI
ncbi:putative golgin candidate 5 isoform X1 [Iris pallida]|uniref:Golgin candidate 5 isoform X1 n=1 Tax=Iris pallida TaxID=29817 RepID=A0AAX6G373_IRIPA|nr:putative golgin candidate 5 isoform X1 [Iris pallida]